MLLVADAHAAAPERHEPAAAIPYREEKPVQESASRALLSALVLLGVAAAAFYFVRRRLAPGALKPPAKSSLTVLQSAKLGTSARLWVVEFDGERLLLAENGQHITLVATGKPAPAQVADAGEQT
jgi:flagellar biogenesis protein FliO